MSPHIFLLRDPISGLRSSPHRRAAAVLDPTSGRSRRKLHDLTRCVGP